MTKFIPRLRLLGGAASLAIVLFVSGLSPIAAQASGASPRPEAAQKSLTVPKESSGDPSDEYRQSPMVTKLGSMIGMDAQHASVAFTLSNLVILIGALGLLLAKKLPATFKTRSTGLKKQLVDARSATEEASARLSAVEYRLSKLDDQIAQMRQLSEADAEREGERIRALAEEEKNRILAAASMEIQTATSTARRELMSYAADLAVEQAARKLVITPDIDRILVQRFVKGISTPSGEAN